MTTSPFQTYNLPELSFILHYRKDSEDREMNLMTVLSHLTNNYPESEIIVVDDRFDLGLFPQDIVEAFSIKLVYFCGGDQFQKSASYNKGAKKAKGKILAFWDVDIVVNPYYVHAAYKQIENGTGDHVYPFNGTFIDVQKDLFREVIRENWDNLYSMWENECPLLHFASGESPGGCNLISREAFERMGGYDERFIGWGFEDTDYLNRSLKKNKVGRIMVPEAICWHLHHDQAVRTENPHYMNNLQIFNANRFQ